MTDPVEPRAAATVVLMRDGPDGPEVLLGRRPPTMAFAPDVHVFPGGRVDSTDAHPSLLARSVLTGEAIADAMGGDIEPTAAVAAAVAAIREAFEEAGVLLADGPPSSPGVLGSARAALVGGEIGFPALAAQLDLTLRTDWLAPLSRWVTPPGFPRRFDARFFAAALPPGAVASLEGDEVVDQVWIRPIDALDALADGSISFWLPTSATLQQLRAVVSFDEIPVRLAPGRPGDVVVDEPMPGIVRVEMPAGGGVAGQPVNAYVVGRQSVVIVDPGDPTGLGLDRVLEVVAGRGGSVAGIALTHADPDHGAGAELLALQTGAPVYVGPGGGRHLPYEVRELADEERFPVGDIEMRVLATPGPSAEHIAFVLDDGSAAISGDLDGRRGARMIPAAPDDAAWAVSRARLEAAVPSATRLGGHPPGD